MPIRFRCKYCDQLMGIARRKVGKEVECPTCKGKLLVPQVSAESAPTPGPMPALPPENNGPLLERSDFGDFLDAPAPPEPVLAGGKQPITQPGPPQRAPTAPRPLQLPSSYDLDGEANDSALSPHLDPHAPGIVLSPARATILTVAIILGLALAFSAGLLVGKAL